MKYMINVRSKRKDKILDKELLQPFKFNQNEQNTSLRKTSKAL